MLDVGVLVGGDYRVERKLSDGGMGAVFVAEQVSTGAKRALKIIRPELLRHPKLRERFAQEAKVTSGIASDHVVSVVAAGFDVDLGVPWLAMELLEGETLFDLVATRGPLAPETAITILSQLSHAMDAAHAAQVVHRDLKPENVFLATSRRSGFPFFVKVLDFGIARIMREAHTNTESLGTPLWMSPEQAGSGDAVGPWTDIWSFGLIGFFLLTGRSYWLAARGEGTTLAVVREVCIDALPAARERAREIGFYGELPEGFDAWFAGCVCREIAGRFASAGEAVRALEEVFGFTHTETDFAIDSPRGSGSRPRSRSRSDSRSGSERISSQGWAPVPSFGSRGANLTPSGAGSEHDVPESRNAVAHAKTEIAPLLEPSHPTEKPPAPEGTPALPLPPVSVTQPSVDVVKRSSVGWGKRAALGAFGLACLFFGVLGARSHFAKVDAKACQNSSDEEACARTCARGDDAACTRMAQKGISSRDAAKVAKSLETLRTVCNRGQAEACGTLGSALGFPMGEGLVRDAKAAAENLEKACRSGHMCALAGVARELGWPGLAKDPASYFDASCTKAPVTPAERLDCAWAVAHDLEGPPEGKVSPRLEPLALAISSNIRAACNEQPGDACGLVWLDKKATLAELFGAYERGCDAGSSLACNNLGALRAEGAPDRPPSPTLARETFERACAVGEPAACNNLAFVVGGLVATVRRGPRGATVYKLRCSGGIQVGCAGWGDRVEVVPKGTPVLPKEAVATLERACGAGLTTACVNLGAFTYLGRGAPQDRARAEKLFAESCFRGDASACGEQGTALLTLRMDHPRDVRAGFGFLDRACKGGEEDSCMALYGHMVNGLPDHKREAEGIAGLLRLASRKLYARTLVQLYETGAAGLGRDLAEARRIAIATCDADARCADASYFFARGIGGPRDDVRAIEVLLRGCESDDYPSCTELGARHREGRGTGKDPTRAAELFKKACDGADATACDMLSRAYASAEGVPRDLPRALALARAACESGGAEGCSTVGVMMAEGKGTEKNADAATPYLAFGCRRAVQSACQKLQELKKPLPELDL